MGEGRPVKEQVEYLGGQGEGLWFSPWHPLYLICSPFSLYSVCTGN